MTKLLSLCQTPGTDNFLEDCLETRYSFAPLCQTPGSNDHVVEDKEEIVMFSSAYLMSVYDVQRTNDSRVSVPNSRDKMVYSRTC